MMAKLWKVMCSRPWRYTAVMLTIFLIAWQGAILQWFVGLLHGTMLASWAFRATYNLPAPRASVRSPGGEAGFPAT